jgi:hypothetical protein
MGSSASRHRPRKTLYTAPGMSGMGRSPTMVSISDRIDDVAGSARSDAYATPPRMVYLVDA